MTEGEREAELRDPFGLSGTLLERKYRVDRVVAEGGFGVVYAGHHLVLDVPIAIKALRPVRRAADDEGWGDVLSHFLLEATTLAKLRSPSVVTAYDAGVWHSDRAPGGVSWIVLEWIEGETLQEDLARRRGQGGRTPAQCMELLRGVMEAIAEAHENGIAHRDLKPSNVMLERTKRGTATRVLDFGIAKMMEREEAVAVTGETATAARFKAFSPAYAAPEQVSGTRTGPWTDVHALGLMLSELLTDAPPYPVDDPNVLYRAVFDEVRPTPARRGVDVGAWEAVLARALAIKPQERYASAGELLAALDAGLEGALHRVQSASISADPRGRSPLAATLPFAATERSGSSVALDAARRSELQTTARRRRNGAAAIAVVSAVTLLGGATLWLRARARAQLPAADPRLVEASAGCESNAACTASSGGVPSICRRDRGACVPLASVDCVPHADPRAMLAPDTVWLGTLFPTTGPSAAEFGVANTQAAELAWRDFAQIMGGTSAAASVSAPAFGLLACDDAADARRAVAHLIEVGVPAVIGFQSGGEAMELASSTFIPNRVLAISALGMNALVTAVPQPAGTPRLVWRTASNSRQRARAMSALVTSVIEPQLRAAPGSAGLDAHKAMRVAVIRPKSAPGAAFGEEVAQSLVFNGKGALANGADFRELTYGAEGQEGTGELAAIEHELASFLPQAILYVGGAALLERIFAPLEARWPDARAPRPRYVSAAHFYPELLAFLGKDRDRRRRYFGTMMVSTTPQNARFVTHYNETFADRSTLTDAPNTAYDAFYLLAYAAYASEAPITGPSLARAMGRMQPSGRKIDVGLTGIFEAFSALRRGEPIDLEGSSGSLDLDPATGEGAIDQAILCAGLDAAGRAADGIESGLVYRTASRKLEGEMHCP